MSIPLSYVGEDVSVVIKSVSSDGSVSKKLANIGLRPNGVLSVFNRQNDGGVVVGTDGMKVAIDGALARKIMVQPA